MAIRKKIATDLRVVSRYDDAVDWTATPILEYLETRDPDKVVELDGEAATWFTIRPLPPGILSTIEAQRTGTREFSAFSFGVVDCSDKVELGLQWDKHRISPALTDESIGGIPKKVVLEIGTLILEREDLSEGESLRSARLRG
jgi:hypothetical protein